MRRNILLGFGAATTAAFMAGPALAQTDRSRDFDGFYVGAGGGFGSQNADRGTVVFDTNQDGNFDGAVPTITAFCGGYARSTSPADGCTADKDRGEYFGRVGYDRRFGNFVVGGLIEAGDSNTTDRTSTFDTTAGNYYRFSRSMDWTVAARLRGGYTPGGGVLFYATGGGAYANMQNRFTTTDASASFTANDEDDAWGWQTGGGVEALVTPRIGLGLEYLYSSFDNDDYHVTATGGAFGTGTNLRPSDSKLNFHSIRGTVSFRF